MRISDFTDERIAAVIENGEALTDQERTFLVENTPTFEECGLTGIELAALSDTDLMRAAYHAWADYASGQI